MTNLSASHTPGPWHLSPDGRGIYQGRSGDTDVYVAEIFPNYGLTIEEANANARLIAAAPELLAALRILTEHAQEQYPHIESERGQRDIAQALAAITKAEGRA